MNDMDTSKGEFNVSDGRDRHREAVRFLGHGPRRYRGRGTGAAHDHEIPLPGQRSWKAYGHLDL